MADIGDIFAQNVVEVVAVRRNPPPPGRALTRRFLCTNSFPLLNSIAGKTVFHFRAPSHPPPYDARARNLVTVFDLFMQDYRNINLNDYNIVGAIPVRTEEEIARFWDHFNGYISKLSTNAKESYMNRS